MAKRRLPGLRMIAVAGPRIDPESLRAPDGVELRAFVPDLHRHLAACDLAIVQGGLTTCMELTAAGTPFIYVPLRNHFEQNFHVHHRLRRYGAGRRMDYGDCDPDSLAAAIAEELAAPASRPSRPMAPGGRLKWSPSCFELNPNVAWMEIDSARVSPAVARSGRLLHIRGDG